MNNSKFIFLLLILLVGSISLSAQITQEEADDIVWERLSRVSVLYYSLFAKEDVQENMIIETATGEILELDYPCWVYYINTMDFYLIVNKNNGNVLEIKPTSESIPNDLEEWREVGVKNTRWRLLGIVDTETGDMKEREYDGYTIIFETDSTFGGISEVNIMDGKYKIDYKTGNFYISELIATERGGDWWKYTRLYFQVLYKIQSFVIKDTHPRTLYLYDKNGEYHLKYEEIGGRNE